MPTNWPRLKARAKRRHGLTPTEFAALTPREWLAFELDLAAEERSAWLRTGVLCATLANCHRDPKRGRAFRPSDFMPRRRKRQTPEEQMAILDAASRAFGRK